MKKKYLIFDLDGTLIKSMTGTVNIISNYINSIYPDIKTNNVIEYLNSTAGTPLLIQLNEILKDKKGANIKEICNEIYNELGNHDSEFFPGVPEKIIELSKNYKLFLTTGNSNFVANKFLEQGGIKNCFEIILGSNDILKGHQHLDFFKENSKDADFYKKSFYIGDGGSDRDFAKEKEIDFIHIGDKKIDKYELSSVVEIDSILNNY